MKNKVKYTRNEYRKEYLRSDEWRAFRDSFIKIHPLCQKCGTKESHDVHHLKYNEDVHNITEEEVIAVCRRCHKDIHDAIKYDLIPQRGDINYIRRKTLFLDRSKIDYRKKYLRKRHRIGDELTHKMLKCHRFTLQRLYGEIGVAVSTNNFSKISQMYITGSKIEKIKKLVKRNASFRGHHKKYSDRALMKLNDKT